ncbi:DUF2243 domain-containing protein [Conyzicola sp.]|uniref:DUF2243 domain-containing protein n=1 Tax=Conyzicola sp. TaxID=1969404 RepID=UPI003989D4FB
MPSDAQVDNRRRTLVSGIVLGVGVAGFVDEVVFHQLLHWHHFYDRSTPDIGLVSDGIFHAVSWFATVGGMFLLADLHRRHGVWWTRWIGGLLLGAGAFQLFDGTVQHKLLGLHQIRYEVDLLPYDIAWNVAAGVLVVVGVVLVVRTRRASSARE